MRAWNHGACCRTSSPGFVRALARYLAGSLHSSIDVRAVYVDCLNDASTRRRTTAIDGLGETGTRADAALLDGLFAATVPKIRRAALRAAAKLDADRVFSSAVAALEDSSGAVRSTALSILEGQAHQVDFAALSERMPVAADPRVRITVLRLLAHAPKWDAAAYLLAALRDPDATVRSHAARLLHEWTEVFNRSQIQPAPRQLQRIRALLDAHVTNIDKETAGFIRFAAKEGV